MPLSESTRAWMKLADQLHAQNEELRDVLSAVMFFSRFYLTRNRNVIPAQMDAAWRRGEAMLERQFDGDVSAT